MNMPRPRSIRFVALAVLAVLTASCQEDFAPYNRLTALRALAIRSNPPTPGPGETATLDALIYTPDGAPVTHAWSWCPLPGPASAGYPCQVTDQELAMLAGGGTLPPLDLGTAPTATLAHSFDPQILAQACARVAGEAEGLLNCNGGFPIQVRLTVTSGGDTVDTVTTLRLRFDPADAPNDNPSISTISAVPENGPEQTIKDDPIVTPIVDALVPPVNPIVTLPRDEETPLVITPAGELAQPYNGPNDEGERVDQTERLRISWFVETGSTKSDQTSFNIERGPLAQALRNEWTPALTKDYAKETARIFVVVRDNRGGVGWRSGIVLLGADR